MKMFWGERGLWKFKLSTFKKKSWQNSLTRSAPLNSDSQGRFGNRFLSSYDHRFVIKTVSSEDIAEMHNILKKYHQVEAPRTTNTTDRIKNLSILN